MRLADLPSPKGLPVLHQLPELIGRRFNAVLEQWADELGPMFVVRAPPQGEVLVVADAELVRKILRARPARVARYRTMREVIDELGVTGVFTAEGEAWRRQRKLVMAGFNSRAMLASFDQVAEITERLRVHWEAARGEPVDVLEDLMRYTIDITGAVALGRDLDTIRRGPDVLRRHLEVVFPALIRRIASPFPYWRWGLKRREDRELEASVAAVREIVLDMVRDARARIAREHRDPASPKSLLEALLLAADGAAPDQASGARLSDEEVYSNLITILLAGEDTTANTTAWMLHHASRNAHVRERLRAEADDVLGDAPVLPSHEAARRLRYTRALMLESGRMNPIGAVMFLETVEAQVIGSVRVPADTPVFLLLRHIMTRREHFGRPHELMPERWLDDERPVGLAHSPKLDFHFGGGPRICPGRPMALLEGAMVTSMVAKHFDIEATQARVREKVSFTMGPAELKLRFAPRRT